MQARSHDGLHYFVRSGGSRCAACFIQSHTRHTSATISPFPGLDVLRCAAPNPKPANVVIVHEPALAGTLEIGRPIRKTMQPSCRSFGKITSGHPVALKMQPLNHYGEFTGALA